MVVAITLLDVINKAEGKLIAERRAEAVISQLRELDPVYGEQVIDVLQRYFKLRRQGEDGNQEHNSSRVLPHR